MSTESGSNPALGLNPEMLPSGGSTTPGSQLVDLLDRLLRQRTELFENLFANIDVGRYCRLFFLVTVLLGAFYGATMGASGLTQSWSKGLLQIATSAIKVPSLFLLTLAVTFPVLYVVIVLMGVRLRFLQTLALILMATAFNALLLASCAPITVFFIITGASYPFIKLLHVAIFSFSGLWAMSALWHGLRTMCERSDLYPLKALRILQAWVLVFGFVGTQMAWSLRPFVGDPNSGFQVFRAQQGNFYQAVAQSLSQLVRND